MWKIENGIFWQDIHDDWELWGWGVSKRLWHSGEASKRRMAVPEGTRYILIRAYSPDGWQYKLLELRGGHVLQYNIGKSLRQICRLPGPLELHMWLINTLFGPITRPTETVEPEVPGKDDPTLVTTYRYGITLRTMVWVVAFVLVVLIVGGLVILVPQGGC
jgi:hypothetical protein